MGKEIRVYVHGKERKRVRYSYPSHYKLSTCLEKSGIRHATMAQIKAVGFEDGALTVHVRV